MGKVRPSSATGKPKVRGLYLKHGKYVYQPPQQEGHRPKPIHLSTADFTEAVLLIDEIKRRQFQREASEPLAPLVDEFFRSKLAAREHRPGGTARAARPALKRMIAFFRVQPSEIATADLRRWRDAMAGEGLSNATIASYLRYGQSFFSWLVATDRLVRNPFGRAKDIFPKSIPTRRERYCTKAERDRLIQECPNPDLKAVLFIGFHAGLRRNEILNIRPHWIVRDPETDRPKHFHVQNESGSDGTSPFTIKDSEAKHVPISTPLADFLIEFGLDRSPYLIRPDIEHGKHVYRWEWKRSWNRYLREQGMAWVGVHTMRHTFITLLLSADPERRPSLLHLSRWTGTGIDVLNKSYAHLIEDPSLIDAAI